MTSQNKSEASPIKAGLRCKCPTCQKGHLFKAYLKVADYCDHCGTDFLQEDSGDGAAPFIMIIVGIAVAFLAAYTELIYEPPYWLHFILWFPLSLILTLGLLQPLKGVMINIQFHHNARGIVDQEVDD
jgi:uncharacterized protein (DUF983 family)